MPEINLPTYAQVESLKTSVETVGNHVSDVKLETTTIVDGVNTINSSIAAGVGTDWSKFKPFFKSPAAVFSPNPDTYKIMYEVTGKGYLSLSAIRGHSIGLGIHMKISIDGHTVLEINSNVNNNTIGFFSPETIVSDSVGAVSFAGKDIESIRIAGPRAEFKPELQSNCSFLSTQPLFFNSSMKIELKAGSPNDPGNFPLYVAGGVIL